jgi:hypothetical protein
MEEPKAAKGNKLDLIFNMAHPVSDYEGLKNNYFSCGNVFLGGKEAVSDQFVYTKNIGAVLSIIDKKSF